VSYNDLKFLSFLWIPVEFTWIQCSLFSWNH